MTQSCQTLWDPMECSLPGSSVHEILQARKLERVAIPFSYSCVFWHFGEIKNESNVFQ